MPAGVRARDHWASVFAAVASRKARDAATADISPLVTTAEGPCAAIGQSIGNAWTRAMYDGPFQLMPAPEGLPAISLVFVESRDGNTGAANPADLGGGATDFHLIYEGLSRVAADGVLAGGGTARGESVFFSVWHPELIALRASLGLPRHPAQIVVSDDGRIDIAGTLLFNVPEVPTFVIAGAACRRICHELFRERPWITVVPFERGEWDAPLGQLRGLGLSRLSVVGGRTTATSLVDAGFAQDLCLTTTGITAGEPGTPWYDGRRPPFSELIVEKHGGGEGEGIRFRHLMIGGRPANCTGEQRA